MIRVLPVVLSVLPLTLLLSLSACASSKGAADATGAVDAAATDPPADTAEQPGDGTAADAVDAAADEGGKTANPGRSAGGPPGMTVTWDDKPLQLGFPTKAYEVYFGQGMCKPAPACQELKAVKGDTVVELKTRDDVLGLVGYMEDKDQAMALVRFFTDHRYVLSDEHCAEVEVAADGTIDIHWPSDLDLEALPVSMPAKVVDFEGGFRIDRTLICLASGGDEPDRLIKVSEMVFSDGDFTREETEVLLEHEMWMPRLK